MATGRGTLTDPNDPHSDFVVSCCGRVRCTSWTRQSNRRCKRFAIKGRTKCRFHGGMLPVNKSNSYVKMAGLEALETDDPLGLDHELELARVLLMETCDKMHRIQTGGFEPDVQISLSAKCMAIMIPMVEQVRRLVESSAKVQLATGNMFSKDSAKFLVITLMEIVEDELGKDVAEKLINRLQGRLPIAGDVEYLARRRIEVVYPDGDDTAELSADPYLPLLPPSQEHLASEIPGATSRKKVGKDSLDGGKNGKAVPKKKRS